MAFQASTFSTNLNISNIVWEFSPHWSKYSTFDICLWHSPSSSTTIWDFTFIITTRWHIKVIVCDIQGDYAPFQLLCPISYNFVTVDERVWEIVENVTKKGEKNIRLAPEGMPTDPDMIFTTDLGLYIDKNIKITYLFCYWRYRKRPLKLKEINPEFYIPVLMILKSYLGVLGKEVFDIFTFTFWHNVRKLRLLWL